MGIAGSIINTDFFEKYLGMRVESVDEVEIIRRMTEGIYDEKEYNKALKWVKSNCKQGFDKNPERIQKSEEEKEKEKDLEFVVKMMCIIKDLYNGNPNIPKGCEEEMIGHIGADLITLCSMLRIPVCMHNVSEDKIFRPALWI